MRSLLACVVLGVSGAAHAEPGGTSGVSSPRVSEGELRMEARTGVFQGGARDGDRAHRALASYGVNQWWRAAVVLRAAQPEGEGAELSSVGWENTFDFTATRDWPVHFGSRFEYKFGVHDNADEIEFKVLAERRFDGGALRLNVEAVRTLEDGADWTYGYSARGAWDVGESVTLGLEGFGDFDLNAHYWGPRAGVEIGDVTLAAGYLIGFSDAASDGQFRLSLEWTP